jgi:predicted O-methyltransferase YrrM
MSEHQPADLAKVVREVMPQIQYIRETFAPEDELLQKTVKRIHANVRPIQVGAEEGKLLEFLIKMAGVKTVVEIGTLLGYSTLWMARALPDDGHIHTLEHDPDCVRLAHETFAGSDVENKITLVEGLADQNLPELSTQGPFDMVFIDADKNNYGNYLTWAEANVRKGGLIIGDNTFLFGAVHTPLKDMKGVRRATRNTLINFNKRLADPTLYNSIMLPTEQGITIAQKLY